MCATRPPQILTVSMTVAPTPVHPGSGRHGPLWIPVLLAFLLGGLGVALLYHFDVIGSSTPTTGGSGRQATQVRRLPAFTGVELSGSNNVVIGLGTKQSVVVRGDDNLLDRVTTRVRSGALRDRGNPAGGFTTRSPMSVRITVPALDAVTLLGSGDVVVADVRGESTSRSACRAAAR